MYTPCDNNTKDGGIMPNVSEQQKIPILDRYLSSLVPISNRGCCVFGLSFNE